MHKRFIGALVAVLLLFGIAAQAEGLPHVTDAQNQAVGYAAEETDAAVPEDGEWNALARAVSGADAELLDQFRTRMAITATELDFNSYAYMNYSEKAFVVTQMIDFAANGCYAVYGEGESAADNAVIPAALPAGGEFAVFALADGAWVNLGMFTLAGEAENDGGYYLLDVSCYETGDSPAYVAWHDEAEDVWRVVGINQAYVDLAIRLSF